MPAPTPGTEETQDEYLDRCNLENETEDEGERQSECQLRWDQSQDDGEGAPPDDEEGKTEARARRLRARSSINKNRGGGSMDIRAVKQEKAELMGEVQTIKREARGLLTKTMAEDRRQAQLDVKQEQVEAAESRLTELAHLEAQWELFKEEDLGAAPARTGSDEPNFSGGNLPTPFRSFGDQLAAVAAYTQDPRTSHPGAPGLHQIQAALGASEGISSDGGWLVQTDFTTELLRLVHETGKLTGLTDRKPISANSNGMKINAVDETSRVDGSRWGGVQAFWAAEAATITASKPKYRQMELNLQKLTGLYYATDELLMDTVALGAFAGEAFAEEFGFKLDDALIRGAGGGMPLGILGHAGTIDVAKETNQVAKTIVAENVENMWSRAWARGLMNSEWFINQDVWPQLFQLSHAIGTGGVPMFMLPGGLVNAPFGSLMGRPVTPIEQCETLGTSGDIILADWSQYLMIEKGGIEAASSIHVQFLTDELTFRFILRADGQPKRNAALTPYRGTNTQSPFVTLATRA